MISSFSRSSSESDSMNSSCATNEVSLSMNSSSAGSMIGDISPLAGGSVYGVFGGSSGVTNSGGVIGNNASGNIIAGNIMTILR